MGTWNPHHRSAQSLGFTLVELLVVLAIVLLLAALLLPALQAARESARRLECEHHLKQLGLGMLLYEGQHKTLPPGGIEWRSGNDLSQRQLAWGVFLLPWLEQQALFDQLDLNLAFDHPDNAAGANTELPLFLCPSAIRQRVRLSDRGRTDFGGMYGERITSPNAPPKGSLVHDRAFALAEITDGASQTMLLGETVDWPDGEWINARNLFDQAFPLGAAPRFENDLDTDHPTGPNILLVDGSCRGLSPTIDTRVLAALCTREGDEPFQLSAPVR